ncbi:MAG: hypothetical protein RLY85_1762, partial [Bacteroidota bacterium]
QKLKWLESARLERSHNVELFMNHLVAININQLVSNV